MKKEIQIAYDEIFEKKYKFNFLQTIEDGYMTRKGPK